LPFGMNAPYPNATDETDQSDGKRLPQGQYASAAVKGSAIVGT
jgi:hypothetical protein